VDDIEDQPYIVRNVHLPFFIGPKAACVLLEQLAYSTSCFSTGGTIIRKIATIGVHHVRLSADFEIIMRQSYPPGSSTRGAASVSQSAFHAPRALERRKSEGPLSTPTLPLVMSAAGVLLNVRSLWKTDNDPHLFVYANVRST
jgi:hypothetical protein